MSLHEQVHVVRHDIERDELPVVARARTWHRRFAASGLGVAFTADASTAADTPRKQVRQEPALGVLPLPSLAPQQGAVGTALRAPGRWRRIQRKAVVRAPRGERGVASRWASSCSFLD